MARCLPALARSVAASGAAEARLSITDKLTTYRRATRKERIVSATRMDRSFSSLTPGLDRGYFVKGLEETTNIGDPRDIELDAAVKLCVGAYRASGERPEE